MRGTGVDLVVLAHRRDGTGAGAVGAAVLLVLADLTGVAQVLPLPNDLISPSSKFVALLLPWVLPLPNDSISPSSKFVALLLPWVLPLPNDSISPSSKFVALLLPWVLPLPKASLSSPTNAPAPDATLSSRSVSSANATWLSLPRVLPLP